MTNHNSPIYKPAGNQEFTVQGESTNGNSRKSGQKLQVMKFGGTSVADADCIARVVEIIRAASRDSLLVVVVSAMSGVTNKLIEAATHSEGGNSTAANAILHNLRHRHEAAIDALIFSRSVRERLKRRVLDLFTETGRLCKGTALIGELTPRASDSISSVGERLSAPLLAAALAEHGVPSEAVEATELVVTNSYHGAAEPKMDLTTERCQSRLRPLLQHGCVPVVTGFIGATEQGELTTLGRGGSDYSATILAAALRADGVIIWKEVDGLLTADPRLVPGARTIPEISYREATELAYFGAKVLHPKTLRAVMQCGIPLWIRNTFAPERAGTRITSAGSRNGTPVKALSAISEVALIRVGGPGTAGTPYALERTLTASKAVRADILLISQSSAQNNICLVVPASIASRTVEALRSEFAHDWAGQKTENIVVESAMSMISVVIQNMRSMSGVVGRIFSALNHENVSIMAIAQGSFDSSVCFLVAQKELQAALIAAHREFQLSVENYTLQTPAREFAATTSTNNVDSAALSLASSANV